MRKKIRRYLCGGIATLLLATISPQVPVQAAPDPTAPVDVGQVSEELSEETGAALYANRQKSRIILKANKLYTQYDVTSDGKPDRLLIKQTRSDAYNKSSFSVYINGKLCFKRHEYRMMFLSIELYTLKNRRNYLSLNHRIENAYSTYDKILTYKNGKLVTAVNLLSHIKNANVHGYYKEFKKISGDNIQFYVELQPMGVGAIEYVITYRPSGYCLKPASSIYPLVYRSNAYFRLRNKWTIVNHLMIRPQPGKGSGFILSGQKVALNKICYKNSLAYVQVSAKINGKVKKGWITCPDAYVNPFFKESRFAG